MRYLLSIISLALALVFFGLGIAQRTVWAPPPTITAQVQSAIDTPLLVIDGATLHEHGGSQTVTIRSDGPISAVVGRSHDVEGWIGDTASSSVRVDDEGGLAVDVGDGTEATAPALLDSDLWVEQYQDDGTLRFTINAPVDYDILIASDGTAAAPSDVRVSWPYSATTPLYGPFITLGFVFLAFALLFILLALRNHRHKRGPQRQSALAPRRSDRRALQKATKLGLPLVPADEAAPVQLPSGPDAQQDPAALEASTRTPDDGEVLDGEVLGEHTDGEPGNVESEAATSAADAAGADGEALADDETAGASDAATPEDDAVDDGPSENESDEDESAGDSPSDDETDGGASGGTSDGEPSNGGRARGGHHGDTKHGRRGRPGFRGRGFRIVAPAVAVALLLGGCSASDWPDFSEPTPSATGTPEPTSLEDTLPQPAVTDVQFKAILDATRESVAAADEARDADAAAERLAGPELAAHTVNYQVLNADSAQSPVQGIPDGDIELLLPQQTETWPRSVIAVVGWQDESIVQAALVFEQASARDNYKLVYQYNLVPGELPQVASAKIGAASLPDDTPLLSTDLAQLSMRYADVLRNGDGSEWASLFDSSDDPVIDGIGKAYKDDLVAQEQNSLIDFTFTSADDETAPISLVTNDRGAIVATSFTDTVLLKPKGGEDGVTVGPEAGTAAQALYGKAASETGYEQTNLVQALFYVPSADAGDGAKVQLLGYNVTLQSAKEVG